MLTERVTSEGDVIGCVRNIPDDDDPVICIVVVVEGLLCACCLGSNVAVTNTDACVVGRD